MAGLAIGNEVISVMHRRTFIEMVAASLVGAAASTLAQQTGKGRRLGILTAGTIGSEWAVFFETLRELGWIEQENLIIERRAAGGKAELVPGLAAELAQLKLDVIMQMARSPRWPPKTPRRPFPL